MQKLSCVILLFVVCGARVGHAYGERVLLDSASAASSSSASSTAGGSARASASARSTGGSATAIASATSEAFAAVESKIVNFITAIITKTPHTDPAGGYCVDSVAALKDDITAVGVAIVDAYADALADVKVDGQGEACAASQSSAEAQADSFVEIFVKAVVKASNAYGDTAAVYAELGGRIDVFASAFASAFAKACAGDDSSAFALQESFAQAIVEPFVRVSFFLLAKVDCGGGSWTAAIGEIVSGFVFESTTAITVTDTAAEGDATADAGGAASASTAERCTGVYNLCCRGIGVSNGSCKCTSSRRARCDAKSETQGGRVHWRDTNAGMYCAC